MERLARRGVPGDEVATVRYLGRADVVAPAHIGERPGAYRLVVLGLALFALEKFDVVIRLDDALNTSIVRLRENHALREDRRRHHRQ